ncbi:hypothetical protein LOK49_LG10G02505 [Camellia lanceoleosa]|uniref:Uncharacterized protein n=1 Tax=Camellia lanceoleosa TaxID=1840588 RepID=A0ACC0G796_9ERIC|nr:hypothetical protein LOK49_LG10G02505 [Camellia lanceoleosa]
MGHWEVADQRSGVDLSGPVKFQVKVDRLRSFEYEREMMGADVVEFEDVKADVVECAGGDDAFVEECGINDTHMCDAVRKDDLDFGFDDVREEFLGRRNRSRKLEVQAVNIVGGFECVLGIKNDEVDRLKKENMELRRSLSVLEDQLADRDVHVVTQAFREVEVRRDECGGSDDGVKIGGDIVCNVSPIRTGMVGADVCNEGVGSGKGFGVSDSDGEQRGLAAGGIFNVDLCDMDDGLAVSVGQTSFVRNIKNKVRQGKKLPDFEYPMLNGRSKKSDAGADVVIRSADFGSSGVIVDVDTVVVKGSKWSGFDINNRLGVWKMMTMEEKCKIKQEYDRHGDRAVIWEDSVAGVVVDFTDVKNLIRQSSLCGNVIDGYVELLKSEHVRMYGADELADKSYFFSSVCLDMVKSEDVRAREKFVRANVSAATDCRFIHFPMCHDGHWTLVVYDTEDGTWKHYNPILTAWSEDDAHHNVATLLKERVTNVMKQTLREFGLDEQSIRTNFSNSLEAVTRCPQQKPGT